MSAKQVWKHGRLGFVFVGLASTWGDVARLIGDTRPDANVALSREHSESRTAFYLKGPLEPIGLQTRVHALHLLGAKG